MSAAAAQRWCCPAWHPTAWHFHGCLPAAGALGARGPPKSTAHQAAEAEALHWAAKAPSPLWPSLTLTPFQDWGWQSSWDAEKMKPKSAMASASPSGRVGTWRSPSTRYTMVRVGNAWCILGRVCKALSWLRPMCLTAVSKVTSPLPEMLPFWGAV